MKQKKLIFPLVVLAMISMLLFSACSKEDGSSNSSSTSNTSGSSSTTNETENEESTQGISVSVQIVKDDETLLDTTVTLEDEEATAGDAFKQACQDATMAYTVTDGLYDGFAGYTSTETDGWLFYHNGELADTGADDTPVADGDVVSFQYENYDEAFGSSSTTESQAA